MARTKNAVATSILLSAVLTLMSQSVFRAMQFDPTEINMLSVIISIVTDLIFIAVQFVSGIRGAFSKIQSEEVTPYVNRNEILKRYLFWKDRDQHDNFAKWITQLEAAQPSKEE